MSFSAAANKLVIKSDKRSVLWENEEGRSQFVVEDCTVMDASTVEIAYENLNFVS